LTPARPRRYADAMSIADTIGKKLTEAFSPESLNVVNESHLHAGHGDHVLSGESHFRVHIVSDAFKGKSRIERHRMINQLLAGELAAGLHALAIHANTPEEAAR
jgi:BolA protein